MITKLWRLSDGEVFIRNDDGTFSLATSDMVKPYRYRIEELLATGAFTTNPNDLLSAYATANPKVRALTDVLMNLPGASRDEVAKALAEFLAG